ncbi:radical SAM protein [Megalodesulfovibrio paquesii]
MINLFVTYRCNLACPYCFARPLAAQHPEHMSAQAFGAFLDWASRAGVPAVAFLGGEPTLHPRLAEMIEATTDAGIAAVLFSNGLLSREQARRLIPRLVPRVSNFVINYNDPAGYSRSQQQALHESLAELQDVGARITFSKNFSPQQCDWEYLLEGIERYGVTAVRYDISRPAAGGSNEFCRPEAARALLREVVAFVRACEARGVRTGLDCSVRLCDLDPEDRRYLEQVSMKFRGICHPSMDVHPDLSASYCLPMQDVQVPDVTAFPDAPALMRHFAQAVRPLRTGQAPTGCAGCQEFMRRCQGGCLALLRATTEGGAANSPEE